MFAVNKQLKRVVMIDKIFDQPGVYKDMQINEYHENKDYLGSSSLKALAKSPALFWYHRENETEPTPALTFGSLVHAMLERDFSLNKPQNLSFSFESDFFEIEKLNRRKKEYQDWKKAQIEAGKQIVTIEQEQTAKLIVNQLLNSPIANLLQGYNEVSFFTEIEVDKLSFDTEKSDAIIEALEQNESDKVKVKVKARPDVLNLENQLIIDYKTCSDTPDERNMQAWILHNRYDLQAGLYSLVLEQFTGVRMPFLFVFLQKTEPYEVGWILIENEQLDIAIEEAKKFLSYAEFLLRTDNRQGVALYWTRKIPRFQYTYVPEINLYPKS